MSRRRPRSDRELDGDVVRLGPILVGFGTAFGHPAKLSDPREGEHFAVQSQSESCIAQPHKLIGHAPIEWSRVDR